MNRIYMMAVGLFFLVAAACNKDDSTGVTNPLPEVSVSAFQDTFNVFTRRDTLKITPIVQNEEAFDYYWTLWPNTEFIPGQGLIKPDTLARTKNLNYGVLQDPGAYILVLNVKEKSTGVTKQVKKVVNISTLNYNGWYFFKDLNNKTDFDFIHSTGRIDNWIAYHNGGTSLSGNAVQGVFVPSFRSSVTSSVYYPTFMALSQNDAAIYRIDNGLKVMDFDNMFFTKPAVRKPQAVFQSINTTNLGFINDGKGYAMSKGTLFGNMPVNANNQVYNNLSPLTASAALDFGFNRNTKTVFCMDAGNFVELKPANGSALQNMKADLQWMTGYTGSRSVALMLFRNPQDTGFLYKLNASYGPLIGSGAMIMATYTIKPTHSLMSASVMCGHYDYDLMYYAVKDTIFKMDIATQTESKLLLLPPGETVTAIQHIKYPEPTGTPLPVNKINYLAIATYNAGSYKVYLYQLNNSGDIPLTPQLTYQGSGRVTSVIYMEQGKGSRIY